MPNRNSNYLTITTDTPEEMKEIKSVILKPGTDQFTLLGLNPMPEELDLPWSPVDVIPDGVDIIEHLKIKRPFLFDPKYKAERSEEQFNKEMSNHIKCVRHQSEHDAIYEKYPDTPDWHSWMMKYVGCKWDCGDFVSHSDTDTEYCISFDTPRCPPNIWFENMCAKFPHATFRMEYEEPGMQFQGVMESVGDGEFVNIEEDYVERCDHCDEKDESVAWFAHLDQNLCNDCLLQLDNAE